MSPWIKELTTAARETSWPSCKMLETPSTASSTCCWVILEVPTYAATLGSALPQPAANKVITTTPAPATARRPRSPGQARNLINLPSNRTFLLAPRAPRKRLPQVILRQLSEHPGIPDQR